METDTRRRSIERALDVQNIAKLADEAIFSSECRLAVEYLKKYVEDWQGYVLERFGELLLFGDFMIQKDSESPQKVCPWMNRSNDAK